MSFGWIFLVGVFQLGTSAIVAGIPGTKASKSVEAGIDTDPIVGVA